MEKEPDWNALLRDHPIFSLPKLSPSSAGKADVSLELSLNTLLDISKDEDILQDRSAPSGRRQLMVIKDSELIVAAGSEIRMTTLADTKFGRVTPRSYKILNTQNMEFEIRQMTLSHHGKLLAVAGAFQVVVIVLPRAGFAKSSPTTVDCKLLQVGQVYHSADSAPVAKIEWHPWGAGGTTLVVMTVDGKLREYDIQLDPEEPQQVLSFVPDKKKNSFFADEGPEREVASFAFGKGKADWGPLTVYAIMRSGDMYAICPYMPQNAVVPSAYIHSLECFVAAKQEFLSKSQGEGSSSRNLTNLYDYQHKYVIALVKQLPQELSSTSLSRLVQMHPPRSVKTPPVRQGPFLLQPSPRTLDGSEGGDATDIVYMAFGSDVEEGVEGETERLGLVFASYQDGRVDVYLDVEKVEARWEQKERPDRDLPMLAVYETIDLGIVASLRDLNTLGLIEKNHPVLYPDPINQDTIYVYHAFGVHALQFESLLRSLALALRGDDNTSLDTSLETCKGTDVQPMLTSFSVQARASNPLIGVSVPNDVYLTYSLFVLTSAMRLSVFPLSLRSETPHTDSTSERTGSTRALPSPSEPSGYYCALSGQPWTAPPLLANPNPPSTISSLKLPTNPGPSKGEWMLTPEMLRYLGAVVEVVTAHVRDVVVAHRSTETRAEVQRQEFARQMMKVKELLDRVATLKGARQEQTRQKLEALRESQREIVARAEALLHGMIKAASPGLSESESKWFEELRRMKVEVMGAGRYDDQSIATRMKLLSKEVDRLLPQLEHVKEVDRKRVQLSTTSEKLGVSQAFEIGKRSSEEANRISNLEKEILKLATKLDITLGPRPTRGEPVEIKSVSGGTAR